MITIELLLFFLLLVSNFTAEFLWILPNAGKDASPSA